MLFQSLRCRSLLWCYFLLQNQTEVFSTSKLNERVETRGWCQGRLGVLRAYALTYAFTKLDLQNIYDGYVTLTNRYVCYNIFTQILNYWLFIAN